MYHAKSKGKARYDVFEPAMRTRVLDRLELANDLRHAVENQELRLHYQVIFSMVTGKITGLEASCVGNTPTVDCCTLAISSYCLKRPGLLPQSTAGPARGLPPDERVQQETPMSRAHHQRQSFGRDLAQPDLIDYVESTLKETGLDPKNLSLEITETVS